MNAFVGCVGYEVFVVDGEVWGCFLVPEGKDAEFARAFEEAAERGFFFGDDGEEVLGVGEIALFGF